MGSQEKKLVWFNAGADDLAHSVIGTPFEGAVPGEAKYMCPLCRSLFTREAVASKLLTAEHVPPGSLGGRELVLTCKKCNNDDGSDLDARARELETMVAILRGTSTDPASIKVHIGSTTLRGNIVGQTLKLPKKINSPDAIKEIVGGQWKTAQWQFDKRKDADNGGRCSWIRAGYLVLFAAFGYRVVLDSAFDIVRQQIDDWRNQIVGSVFAEEADDAPESRRLVARMSEPSLGEHWMVQFGRLRLIYPDFGDLNLYDRVAGLDPSTRSNGLVLGWPPNPSGHSGRSWTKYRTTNKIHHSIVTEPSRVRHELHPRSDPNVQSGSMPEGPNHHRTCVFTRAKCGAPRRT